MQKVKLHKSRNTRARGVIGAVTAASVAGPKHAPCSRPPCGPEASARSALLYSVTTATLADLYTLECKTSDKRVIINSTMYKFCFSNFPVSLVTPDLTGH